MISTFRNSKNFSPKKTQTAVLLPKNNFLLFGKLCQTNLVQQHSLQKSKAIFSKKKYNNLHLKITALRPLYPDYCTPYPRWLGQILGISHPE